MGVIGAIIMPHNLYLHSALVKSRSIDTSNKRKVREANMYYFIEAAIALFISFVINVFVVAVFANGLNGKTNNDIRSRIILLIKIIDTVRLYRTLCQNSTNSILSDNTTFPANNETVAANIYKGGVFLGCQYGTVAMYIWAIGVLAAGQVSADSSE